MSDNTEDIQASPAETEQELSLDEFCMRLSSTDTRVELIGGFHFDEKISGRAKDTETAFRARYEAFAVRPVI